MRSEHGESALEAALVALRSDVGARRRATALALAARSGSIKTVRYAEQLNRYTYNSRTLIWNTDPIFFSMAKVPFSHMFETFGIHLQKKS